MDSWDVLGHYAPEGSVNKFNNNYYLNFDKMRRKVPFRKSGHIYIPPITITYMYTPKQTLVQLL